MFNLANASDPDRHAAETRQGRARWQNDDGQAEHELALTATLIPRRQDVTSIATLHAVTAIRDMIIMRLEQHNMTTRNEQTYAMSPQPVHREIYSM